MGSGSLARDAGRAAPAVCHAHCAGRKTGCLGGHAGRHPHLTLAYVQALERGGAGTGRSALCAAHAAGNLLRSEGWQEGPTWAALLCTSRSASRAREAGPGDCASRAFAPTAIVPVGLAGRRVARCHTHRQVQVVAARGRANRTLQTPLFASTGMDAEGGWTHGATTPSHANWPTAAASEAGRACTDVKARRLDLAVCTVPSPQGLALGCDVTLVSPITGMGTPYPRADAQAEGVPAHGASHVSHRAACLRTCPMNATLRQNMANRASSVDSSVG
ncbi:unnamed protein product [Symbiodinium microadriaticum]|nr:unnamed protein product [Symbiodinium microadriaticum]